MSSEVEILQGVCARRQAFQKNGLQELFAFARNDTLEKSQKRRPLSPR
jgi:hypothetical protein